jgi:hypothetical protein
MSRKLTSKCDGCGVEHVDEGEEMVGMPPILGAGRRRGTDRWGSLSVATGSFPAMFDLCEGCTKRVVDMLELEIPDPAAVMRKLGGLGGLGGHVMPFMPGDSMAPPFGPPWMKPPSMSEFGALSREELRALGLLPPDDDDK